MKGVLMKENQQRLARRWVGVAAAGTMIGALAVGVLASAAVAQAPGVTSTSITIGATVPLTGPAAPGYDEIAPAMDAVFSWVNAHGGVYGRKIKYIYLDDQYNPAETATLTRKLVLQDNIFADVGSLGTPTQAAVQSFLNSQKVPQLFIESGCNCWSNPKYPESFGWQPPYTVEGKILGAYIASHFGGEKVGYLSQDDEFGQDFVTGLNMELAKTMVVSQQTYDAATLSGPLSNQVAALKAAGAQVVAMASIPAATALTMLPAASIGYFPQYVISTVGSDAPTVGPLLEAFTKAGHGSATQVKAAAGLLNGVITDSYFPPESQVSNPWVKVETKLLKDYAPALYAKAGLDGNTEYGVGLALTFVQALQAAGKNLTRQGLIAAMEKSGKNFVTPGFVPPSYSSGVHYGFQGAEVVKLTTTAPPAVTPTGSWTGVVPLTRVEVTDIGTAPVTTYSGKIALPPSSLVSTS
jgi:ABC-type branched-subunit amino acid transport system substrate-binding protein